MSMVEVKETIAEMSVDQRLEIAALITQLNRVEDPEYVAELDRRMAAMDAGHKHSAQTLELRHQDLLKQGR